MRVFGYRSRSTRTAARVRFRRKMGELVALCALFVGMSAFGETPAVGAKAPDFTLSTPTGKTVTMLGGSNADTVLFWLFCAGSRLSVPLLRQAGPRLRRPCIRFCGEETQVLLVYPGPPANLDQHA